MPLPALHRRNQRAVDKTRMAPPALSLRGGRRPTWQSRGGSCDFADGFPVIRPGTARLPRRFAPRNDTSGRRSNGNGAAHRIGGTTAASRTGLAVPAPTGPVRIERRLVQIGNAFPRLPRPLWGLAMTRQGSAAMGTVRRTESAVLLPLRGRAWLSPPLQGQCGLNDGRRMIHSSFFSLPYSLFLISSIPLRGMANHMTKRPESPCLSCKFPQSRRICH